MTDDGLDTPIAGTLMKCLSASTERHITYGVPLTMKAKSLRFL